MEPAVRSPRTESAIITDRAQNGALGLPGLPIFPAAERCWPWKPCRGERNFWMQRREAKIGLRDRKCHQRPKERNDTGENPTEMASLEPARRSVVWKDWMVVCAVRYEPVSDCNSLIKAVL